MSAARKVVSMSLAFKKYGGFGKREWGFYLTPRRRSHARPHWLERLRWEQSDSRRIAREFAMDGDF